MRISGKLLEAATASAFQAKVRVNDQRSFGVGYSLLARRFLSNRLLARRRAPASRRSVRRVLMFTRVIPATHECPLIFPLI